MKIIAELLLFRGFSNTGITFCECLLREWTRVDSKETWILVLSQPRNPNNVVFGRVILFICKVKKNDTYLTGSGA